MTTRDSVAASSRRSFLKQGATAAAASAATLAMPNVVRAQEAVVFKFQSTWPAKDIFHEYAQDFVNRVNEMGGGRLKIELLAAGAVAKALEVHDAVLSGTLDGGHGVTAYWYGKHKAFSLFGTPPAWGWRANQMIGWMKYGGGQALYDELVQQVLGLDLVGFLTGPMPSQPLGWFKQQITDAEQLKGLKYRTVGLSADLFKEMGAAVTIMGGGEIVPAMDRGLLDAAEFNNASSDRVLGFPDVSKVCMLQSFHQNAEQFEILFNKAKLDALPPKFKAIIDNAVEAASADMSWKAADRYSKDYAEMQAKQGVKFYKTPDAILQQQLKIYDQVVSEKSSDPLFAEIVASQKSFAERVVRWDMDTNANRRMAFNHYFGKKG